MPATNNFSVLNLTGETLTGVTCAVNNAGVIINGTLPDGGAASGSVALPNPSDFNDFQLQFFADNQKHSIDLNRDHWFGGSGGFPYSGIEYRIIVAGLVSAGTYLLICQYRNPGTADWSVSADTSKRL